LFNFYPNNPQCAIGILDDFRLSLQCFDTVGWATERASGLYKAGCWFVGGDNLTGRLRTPVVTTTSIILSSNKIPNGDIVVLANPGPPGKWPLKWTGWLQALVNYDNLVNCTQLSRPCSACNATSTWTLLCSETRAHIVDK